MPVFKGMIVLAFLFVTLPSQALGLATEHEGNDPVGPGWSFPAEVLAVANLPSRVYWREVNGDPQFFFKGNIEALNRVLEAFAKIKGDKEILLLPGPSDVHMLDGRRRVPCDWELHAPGGFYAAFAAGEKGTKVLCKFPRLTIYIAVAGPAVPPDVKQVERWILDLDSDQFAVREKASQELEKLGRAAGAALRQSKDRSPSPEQGRRIDQLLEKLNGIDLELIRLPSGVPLLSPKILRERYLDGLKSADPQIRGAAAGGLGELGRFFTDNDITTLLEILKNDRHEYVRRYVASALAGLGKRAAPALPMLREGLRDSDVNIRNAFQSAIDLIEKSKDDPPTPKQLKQQQALSEQIEKFCQQAAKGGQP